MIRKALVSLTGTLEVEIDEDEDMPPEELMELAREEASFDCHCDVDEFHDVFLL